MGNFVSVVVVGWLEGGVLLEIRLKKLFGFRELIRLVRIR